MLHCPTLPSEKTISLTESFSGSGYQFSLNGYFGFMASMREGVELNILGLNIGFDPRALAVKLTGIGRIGLRDPWIDRSAWHKAPVMEQVSDVG
jgi:hypothetical protein